jgi:hypothetical protein
MAQRVMQQRTNRLKRRAAGLLGARREQPRCRRAAYERDEIAPSYT